MEIGHTLRKMFGLGPQEPQKSGYKLLPHDYDFEAGMGRGYVVCRRSDGRLLAWQTLPTSEGLEAINVVGESFRPGGVRSAAFAVGQPVNLVPEPDNPYDANAIAVYDGDGNIQAGYIPKDEAVRIGQKLKGGEITRCIVMWGNMNEQGERVGIRLLLLSPDAEVFAPDDLLR